MYIDSLGSYLKQIRLQKKLTLKEVGDMCSLATSYISRIENGSSTPSLETAVKLCNVYSIDINTIANVPNDALSLIMEDTENEMPLDLRMYILNNPVHIDGTEMAISDKWLLIRLADVLARMECMDTKYHLTESLKHIITMAEIKTNNNETMEE